MSENCPSEKCSGGTKSLTITFEMGPRHTLPCSLENLGEVNFINYGKREGNLELCVGDDPGSVDCQYDCIQFAAEELNIVQDFTPGTQAAVVRLMQVITGQRFVIGYEDEHQIIYWRSDLAEKIAVFEQQKPKEE